jgi:hypothetical protein
MALVSCLNGKTIKKELDDQDLALCSYFGANTEINGWGLFSLNNCLLGVRRGRLKTAKTRQYLIGGR